MTDGRRTCPTCNYEVKNGICTNRWCNYRGLGQTVEQREAAWRRHGVEERTTGAYYDYTGRE